MTMVGGGVVFGEVVGVVIGTLVLVYFEVVPSLSVPQPVPAHVP